MSYADTCVDDCGTDYTAVGDLLCVALLIIGLVMLVGAKGC